MAAAATHYDVTHVLIRIWLMVLIMCELSRFYGTLQEAKLISKISGTKTLMPKPFQAVAWKKNKNKKTRSVQIRSFPFKLSTKVQVKRISNTIRLQVHLRESLFENHYLKSKIHYPFLKYNPPEYSTSVWHSQQIRSNSIPVHAININEGRGWFPHCCFFLSPSE